jgi:hypothetical protein
MTVQKKIRVSIRVVHRLIKKVRLLHSAESAFRKGHPDIEFNASCTMKSTRSTAPLMGRFASRRKGSILALIIDIELAAILALSGPFSRQTNHSPTEKEFFCHFSGSPLHRTQGSQGYEQMLVLI